MVKTKITPVKRILMLALTILMIIPSIIHAEALADWLYEEFCKKFPDVSPEHWGVDYLIEADFRGMLKGYPDGTMKPDRPVTYAECIAMMVRASGTIIIDVDKDWDAICKAMPKLPTWVKTHWAANEIVTAYSWTWIDRDLIADKTMVDTAANRVFATTMWGRIDRFYIMRWNYNNVDKSKLKFSDCEKLNDEQKTCIQMLVEANIIDGFPDGTFKPNDSLTRVQVAKIITIARGWAN